MGEKRFNVQHLNLDFGFQPHTSMLEVEGKDENFEYRHVRNTPQKIRYWKKLGFTEVTEKTDPDIQREAEVGPDGRHVTAGSLVLMKRRREITEKHVAHLRKKARDARVGPRESFKGKGRRHGVEVHDNSQERIGPLFLGRDTGGED